MNPEKTLTRIRQFLMVISAGVFLMTVTELIFLSHWSETIQFLPFILSGWGLLTLALAYFRPTSTSINILRWSMVAIGLLSLLGIYEHMENNLGFQREIQANATFQELALATVEVPTLCWRRVFLLSARPSDGPRHTSTRRWSKIIELWKNL